MDINELWESLKKLFEDWQWEFYINNNCDEEAYPIDNIDSRENKIKFLDWVIEESQEIKEEITK